MKESEKFDCVKMTRDIRDRLYNEHKGLNFDEYVNFLVEESHKSNLWKKIKIAGNSK